MQSALSIYESISPFFKLLYIYDLELYSEKKVRELASMLKNNQKLSIPMQDLYNKLEQASTKNIADKLKKKKDNKSFIKTNSSINMDMSCMQASNIWQPPERNNESTLDQSGQGYSFDQSIYVNAPTNYKQTKSKTGSIFGGALMANFMISDLKNYKSIEGYFKIDSKKNESTISSETLAKLNLNSKNPTLLVDGIRQKFRVSSEDILGLPYLQNNKIIVQSNFSSGISSFKMTFTE